MKPRAAHKTIKTIGTVSAGVALVLAGTVAWLLNKPATGDCGGEAPTNHKVHEIRATKVVVQPWLGEHHVYGIFMVPNRYKHSWQNVAFAPQSGSFTAELDATPQNGAMAGGVGLPNAPAPAYSSPGAVGPTCVMAGNKNYSVVTMAVRGFDRRFAVGERADKQYVDDVLAEPEHYLLRIYVPTRVALWFLVNGLFGDLRRPCDWTLVFMERAP